MSDPNHDYDLPPEWIDTRAPWDDLEPEEKPADLVRDARIQAVRLLNAFAASMDSVLNRPGATTRDVKLRLVGVSFALGLNIIDGRSMTEFAQCLTVERAAVSKIATEFCAAHSLEPSWAMKVEGAADNYAAARRGSIQRNNAQLSHKRTKPFKIPPPLPNEAIVTLTNARSGSRSKL